MKARSKLILVIVFVLLTLTISSGALADDGLMFRRNVSDTPDQETEEAAIASMPFYVPAQAADGTLLEGIDYYDAEGTYVETREYARPLVSIYIDAIEEEGTASFANPAVNSYVNSGVGFGARDAYAAVSLDDGATWKDTNLSRSADLSSFTLQDGTPFPGDVFRMEFAVVDNKILAVWMSRFCQSGSPAYAEVDPITGEEIYPDLFGVAGSQGSVDYTLQGFPEIGEVPYGCVWTARGTLEYDDLTGGYEILWRKAERLTSGRRDPNVQAVAGAEGAGFVIVWQEDPEGLRPGQGLGPGEGWSGAIVHQKTDMWYSYISWDEFDLYEIDPLDPDAQPKPLVPMLVPVRLTDNNMCKYTPAYDDEGNLINPYCYEDFDLNGTPDLCAAEVQWTNPGGTTLGLCQTEDGRVLWGRTGASRTRLSLIDYTRPDGTVSAWVVLAYEETKALGEGALAEDPIDIGKDIFYHTFDMYQYDIGAQGTQLDQPALDHLTGEFFPIQVDDFGNEFYETEIARRFSIIVQPPETFGESGTSLLAIFKQGIINQGGPADIMIRRFVVPDDFDPTVDNPYAIENMVCEDWAYEDGSNPNYVNGLCLDAAINVSSPSIVSCDIYGDPQTCADNFPWLGGETYAKVTEWYQYEENLDDQSWENPYDVAKGHRGFIDGDFVMLMYAWSPNWRANSVGNDKYNLYIRRSFDGGVTWTTTPATLGGDGTCHTENYATGSVEYCYTAGEYEQARNVSQLIGTKVTILDPRYTPTPLTIVSNPYIEQFYFPNYWDDTRDPSRFFVVYETGDNTTVAEGEATPLDLFYSRAYDYGDDYDYIEWYNNNTGEIELRWDWLENKKDDLSGEASVAANPGGTFFYAVWNQWQEPEPDVIENSDIWFRRVMYLDLVDGMPSASVLFTTRIAVGYNLDGEVEFAGAAKDNDHQGAGIVAYRWDSNLDGPLSTDQHFTIPTTTLQPGLHDITFSAQDDEGNWAVTSIQLIVAEVLQQLFMPMMVR